MVTLGWNDVKANVVPVTFADGNLSNPLTPLSMVVRGHLLSNESFTVDLPVKGPSEQMMFYTVNGPEISNHAMVKFDI